MTTDPQFRTDLYQGTAPYYDRYRRPYPAVLFDDLCRRSAVSSSGRLLDLACGTGQIALPLAPRFAAVVAVDQEDEAVALGRARASEAGVDNIRWRTGTAETIAIDGPFALVTIGNAFHRLKRQVVADRVAGWLAPEGGLALVWASTPTEGDRPWQAELKDFFVQSMAWVGTSDRVPATWAATIAADPHEQVLRRAGLDYLGKFEFVEEQSWTIESLIGFAYSTSMLNRKALGDRSGEFEKRMAERLGPLAADGKFGLSASFAYELARRTGPA